MADKKAPSLEAARAEILEASLAHVPFDGWSETAVRAGAEDAGYDKGILARAFPGGPVEIIEYFNSNADEAMLAELEKRDLAAMRVRERITLGVRLRLEQHIRHREAIRRALAVLAQPQHAALALRCLSRTVNAIWRAAGDTATDYNYYTKRGLLAGVYGATVLVWLDDTSDECASTWVFLDRRIADVLKVPQGIARLKARLADFPESLRGFRPTAPRGR